MEFRCSECGTYFEADPGSEEAEEQTCPRCLQEDA